MISQKKHECTYNVSPSPKFFSSDYNYTLYTVRVQPTQVHIYIICYREYFIVQYFQSWEFAHGLSERIARFLRKYERMSDWLKNEQFAQKRAICSFLVSNLSDSLMVAHRFSEQIACFFAKNERVSDLLKKRAIRSFAHFW